MKSRLFHMLGAILIVPVSLVFAGCGTQQDQQILPRPVAVRAAKPVIADMESRLSYLGTVRSSREIRVIAQIQGTVAFLPVSEGSRVRKGEPVAEIDAPDLQAVVARVRADQDYWRRRYESDRRLVEAEAIPQEQAETSKRACLSADAALAEAEARLAKAREFSPMAGTVLSWEVEPGQHVMPGQPILILGDRNPEIHVEIVEEDLRRGIEVGTQVIYQRDGARFQTVVAEISPMASGRGRTFTARAPVAETPVWRWGESVRVDFILNASRACLTVPVEAVLWHGADASIFLIREGRAIAQAVVTGIEQDGWVEVSFPWNGEDRVAISNLANLEQDTPVFAVELQEERP